MAIYSVHGNPAAPEDAVFVREGFSFAAFIFQPFWALYQRMWLTALGLFIISAAISLLVPAGPVVSFANLVVAVIFGFVANDLRRRSLAMKGRSDLGLVAGDSLEEAELRFFLARPSQQATPAILAPAVPRPAAGHEPLGLFG